MSDSDSYPEELYVVEIEIEDYDDSLWDHWIAEAEAEGEIFDDDNDNGETDERESDGWEWFDS